MTKDERRKTACLRVQRALKNECAASYQVNPLAFKRDSNNRPSWRSLESGKLMLPELVTPIRTECTVR